jgi:multidrug resistance efflux pump
MSASEFTTRQAKIISAPSSAAHSEGTEPEEVVDALERLRRFKPSETPPEADVLERSNRLDESAETAAEAEAPESPAQPDAPAGAASEAEALERLARLNETLRARSFPDTPSVEPQPAEPATSTVRRRRIRNLLPSGRVIKSILAVVVAIALAWVPVQRLLSTSSTEATINARLINLRAPIDGTVSVAVPTIAAGTLVKPGEVLLRLTNTRADRKRLDDLRRTASQLRSESSALKKQLEKLQAIAGDLRTQSDAFQESRIRQLETRAAEYTAEVQTTEAQLEDAEKSLNRSKDLKARGYQTLATLLHAERDFKVAGTKVEAARQRLESTKIELEGARKGLFVGDSYNDLPRSAQRVTEVEQQIADLTSQLDERQGRIAYLKKEETEETSNLASNSVADVAATVQGRIWETLTANGEEVRQGQDLLRVLDCAGAVVTATVSESTYNKLWVGQPAKFQLRGMSKEYAGSVAGLTGLTAAGSNYAIDQTALTREPYHVTIAVPALAGRQDCNVGRTGNVTFDTSSGSGPGLTAAARHVIQTLKPTLNLP